MKNWVRDTKQKATNIINSEILRDFLEVVSLKDKLVLKNKSESNLRLKKNTGVYTLQEEFKPSKLGKLLKDENMQKSLALNILLIDQLDSHRQHIDFVRRWYQKFNHDHLRILKLLFEEQFEMCKKTKKAIPQKEPTKYTKSKLVNEKIMECEKDSENRVLKDSKGSSIRKIKGIQRRDIKNNKKETTKKGAYTLLNDLIKAGLIKEDKHSHKKDKKTKVGRPSAYIYFDNDYFKKIYELPFQIAYNIEEYGFFSSIYPSQMIVDPSLRIREDTEEEIRKELITKSAGKN